jgi:lipopolysaccharide export system protein LptA
MRTLISICFVGFFILFAFSMPGWLDAFPEEKKAFKDGSAEKPIVIYSDTLELDQQKKIIVFSGAVQAKSEDMEVECHEMIVYYLDDPAKNKSNVDYDFRIGKIIASGDVIIKPSAGGKALAGKAVFYQDEQKVVLTENPSIQQGPDFVEGDQITMFLNENRSIIEGGKRKRVKATIFPKEEKGK